MYQLISATPSPYARKVRIATALLQPINEL